MQTLKIFLALCVYGSACEKGSKVTFCQLTQTFRYEKSQHNSDGAPIL